ncbi:hypothetical protein H4696_002634 [Amycolatopsis lexingtonensis]|uniref:Uncharacterized protein n=1 Tax=Amycolatopsis lexingtonensis TaxID=218822 RepID=A0ABR9HX70_9PSEU|nr:hypothetical protein [Amycolatopsis lexingtonensis]MBE1495534.1 hypothetical protein [Amycolatopsis lexingtonensis]
MPMPRMPLTTAQAHEVLKDFTTWMIHSVPADWDQLFLTFRSVGGYVELRASIITVLGGGLEWTPPPGVAEFFAGLRDDMARPGEGTWTSLRYHLVHPGRYDAEYDWDGEPDWDHVPSREHFAAEAGRYPRETVPGWLRQRLTAE